MTLYKKTAVEGYDSLTLNFKYDGPDEWVIVGAPAIQSSLVFQPVEEPVYKIDKEAMAIALCHYDGWDYGEPYDQWPDTIFDDSGAPWDDQEEAKSDYRDRVGSMLRAGAMEIGGTDAAGLMGAGLPLREPGTVALEDLGDTDEAL